ncbi:MAG: 50S ribosomal protein L4 [Candidatus Aenigmarchaeota archaeon]|nr:50S ribosomal protein L4 [Candidatus Aenigmarchaeota archaeon]
MPKLYDLSGKAVGDVELPAIFRTPYRPDVIKRAVLAAQSRQRQPYGSDVLAGKRTSAHYHGRRKYRFAMMNKEMSRIPRIHGKGAGVYAFRARFAPHAVKGRRAHPPKAEKKWEQFVNKKERALALYSALAASAMNNLVTARGHMFEGEVPFIVVDDFESVGKTKDIMKTLKSIGLGKELERCARKKERAGRGKMRGRRYKKKKGPLLVASKDCAMLKAAANIPGVDAVSVNKLSAEQLAPGAHAGRLLIITKAALEKFL